VTGRSGGRISQHECRSLAKTGAFCENHCSGFGTNSTPNHLLITGGQSPTLRNPPRNQADPVWDMPSLPGHAADHGLSWKAYTGSSSYPVNFYRQLKGSPNIVRSDRIVTDAKNGRLPELAMVWHDSPLRRAPRSRRDQGPGQDLAGRGRPRRGRAVHSRSDHCDPPAAGTVAMSR